MGNLKDMLPVIATLANKECQKMYAKIILESTPEVLNHRDRKVIEKLKKVGLVEESEKEGLQVTDIFSKYLSTIKDSKPQDSDSVQKFLTNGRVHSWPSKVRDKDKLLIWIIQKSISKNEKISEHKLNERIRNYTNDPALVRRFGVDHGILVRNPSTQIYERIFKK